MTAIDRIAPTRRPAERVAMKQRWAELLFAHWRVPVAALRPLVPAELEIDTFEGDAFVGLVPFTMTGVRPVWAPAVRAISDFHETNVRTYVHYRGRDPGVWFFSLDAANSLAVRIARAAWKLPYHRATMSLTAHEDGLVDYRSERLWPAPTPAACNVRYRVTGEPRAATPGTLEHFLVERYFLYARTGAGLYRGQVHHPAYPVQGAVIESLDETLLAASGIVRNGPPEWVHFAREVRVDVFPLRRVAP